MKLINPVQVCLWYLNTKLCIMLTISSITAKLTFFLYAVEVNSNVLCFRESAFFILKYSKTQYGGSVKIAIGLGIGWKFLKDCNMKLSETIQWIKYGCFLVNWCNRKYREFAYVFFFNQQIFIIDFSFFISHNLFKWNSIWFKKMNL